MPRTPKTAPSHPVLVDAPQALMRQEHPGKWLAWSEDESQIIAVGETAAEVRAAAEESGYSRFIYDWVPPAETRQATGFA